MVAPEAERREAPDRRELTERRSGTERRVAEAPVPFDRRLGIDRRKSERRLGVERRLALDSAAAQVHAALALLTRVAQTGTLRDDELRLLDSAMLRLRFAAERMEPERG